MLKRSPFDDSTYANTNVVEYNTLILKFVVKLELVDKPVYTKLMNNFNASQHISYSTLLHAQYRKKFKQKKKRRVDANIFKKQVASIRK